MHFECAPTITMKLFSTGSWNNHRKHPCCTDSLSILLVYGANSRFVANPSSSNSQPSTTLDLGLSIVLFQRLIGVSFTIENERVFSHGIGTRHVLQAVACWGHPHSNSAHLVCIGGETVSLTKSEPIVEF